MKKNLDLKNNFKFEDLKNNKLEDILNFLTIGKIKIKGFTIEKIQKCNCGKKAQYIYLNFEPYEFINIKYTIIYLCENCYKKLKIE